jgi:methyl coenzyme M reductase beta subunit
MIEKLCATFQYYSAIITYEDGLSITYGKVMLKAQDYSLRSKR